MGDEAEWVMDQEELYYIEYGYRQDPMEWYEEKWAEEQRMRKMTLKEVLKCLKRK